MEITLEAIISLIGIIVGGGSIGGFLFWKQTKRRAKAEAALAEAEAKLKEAEAKKAEIEAKKEDQDYYQRLAKDLAEDREDRKRQNEELRAERDHYKESRDNYRDLAEKFENELRKLRQAYEKEREQTNERIDAQDRKIARMGNQIVGMRPFQCGDLKCKKRVLVTISECEETNQAADMSKKTIAVPPGVCTGDIEPINDEL
jgi:chromosome segregation ATPase